MKQSKYKSTFLGEIRKRHCPELGQRTLPIHLEHCMFLSLKARLCCCSAPVRSAGMCDINRLLKNRFCKRGKVKLHLILRDKVFLALEAELPPGLLPPWLSAGVEDAGLRV